MTSLPPALRERVDALVAASGRAGAAAREVRDDLERHVLDALDAGRSPEEILERLGEPDRAGPVLARSARPPTRRPDPDGGESLLRALLTDLRFAARALRRSPTLALTATLVLALGIGANAVVFTVANELLLQPLPVEDQETLVDVWPDVQGGNSFLGFGWEDYRAYREGAGPLQELAAFAGTRVTLGEGDGGRPAVAQLVTGEYPSMLGLRPTVGTFRLPTDAPFGSEPVAVLSHALWTERFGADPGVVGRTVRVDGRPVTVVGVGPEDFQGHFIGFPVDLWMPMSAAVPFLAGFDPADRSSMPLEMIGRLRPGATPEAAQAALNAVARRLEAAHPDTHRGRRVGVTRTTGVDHSLRGPVNAFVAILTVVAGLVLVIACLNVGGVLLVRTMSRAREMAVRLALGAGNGRLVRQLVAESGLLAALGGGAGILLALVLNERLGTLLRALTSGLGLELALDGRVLALTAVAAAAAAVVASAAPALHLLRKAPASALAARGEDVGGSRARSALVVGQVAVSVALVIATGLFVRALARGLDADPGFDADRVATFPLEVDGSAAGGDGGGMAAPALLETILAELAAIPGVEAVAVADAAPLGVARSPLRIQVPGVQPPAGEDAFVVDGRRVGAGWLEAAGIPLVAGRAATEREAREGPQVAVVSEAFAHRFWPDGDAVGRTFSTAEGPVRVVGVARDVQYLVQHADPDPVVYLSLAGGVPPVAQVLVRASEPEGHAGEIRRVVARHLPARPAPTLRTPRETLDAALLPQRLGAAVVGTMGLAALFLAAVGLYGLIQFTVTRHRHELAVRRALGGSRSSVLAAVLRRGLVLVGMGVALGVPLAALGARALSGFLLGVSPVDPLTYGTVLGVFAVVALLASWRPARRAARIEPAQALREG